MFSTIRMKKEIKVKVQEISKPHPDNFLANLERPYGFIRFCLTCVCEEEEIETENKQADEENTVEDEGTNDYDE